ncbi:MULTISPECIES: helix-turn-helix domain-containing protein [unclassified Nocardioides]|uniref:helix-turn-helix domain-containing protein n=1 Tax=unclassified Nocardioides TaxID=2615069 RepID=UPI0006F209B4|nr:MULTISPECIES: helix-turn-helix domain-containing protein [unclassified Nocardioides]KRA38187.1 hypothetical protein ASD81_05915 [Nocardioides sp. Root614]KRA92147.1 hypothetical protein ASD84_06180 [Nocardioides sp. Root682]
MARDKFGTSFESARVDRPFRAMMWLHAFEGFAMARVRADGHLCRRSASNIADGGRGYFLVAIVIGGHGRLEQSGRVAALQPGTVTYWDTSRPMAWHFDGDQDVLLLRISHERAALFSATAPLHRHTARAGSRGGALALFTDFFLRLSDGSLVDPEGTRLLANQGAGLLTSAMAILAAGAGDAPLGDDLLREQVLSYLRRNLEDPTLSPDVVARAVNVSRRSLYRLFGGTDSVMCVLRRLRIERAKQLLISHPGRSVVDVGAQCGLAEGQFHRAFRDLVSMSPAEYRATLAVAV